MPFGVWLSLVALGCSMVMVEKAIQNKKFGRIVVIASVLLLVTVLAGKLDSGFWAELSRH